MYQANYAQDWYKSNTTPVMLAFDQEPVDRSLYSKEIILANRPMGWPETLSNELKEQFIESLWNRLDLRYFFGLSMANGYDKWLLCHSEKNSEDIEYYSQRGFIPVYYWSHALIARDWFRYAEHDPSCIPNLEEITTDFLVFNRAWAGSREYRLKFTEMIVINNLQAHCNMKFAPVDNGVHYTEHVFKNPALQISSTDLQEFLPENTTVSSASADYDVSDYGQCGIEIVLETIMDSSKIHLTEKILRPIALARPFMVVSSPGSLQYLRDYGFKTFDGLIDETYDTIIDPVARMQAIQDEMIRISNLSDTDKNALYSQLYAIAQENKSLFFSDAWGEQVVNELKTNFDLAYDEMLKSKSGSHMKYVLNEWINRYPAYSDLFFNASHRSRGQFEDFLSWCDQP